MSEQETTQAEPPHDGCRDARDELVRREDAAVVADEWKIEVQRLPAPISRDFAEGWEAACDMIALSLRWEGFHL